MGEFFFFFEGTIFVLTWFLLLLTMCTQKVYENKLHRNWKILQNSGVEFNQQQQT